MEVSLHLCHNRPNVRIAFRAGCCSKNMYISQTCEVRSEAEHEVSPFHVH